MKLLLILTVSLLTSVVASAKDNISLSSPSDFQVIQRDSQDKGSVNLLGTAVKGADIEWRVSGNSKFGALPDGWQKIPANPDEISFQTKISLPAGGWYRMEVRASHNNSSLGEIVIEQFGIGEVFVVAGQSNSANYGEEKQNTTTKLVTAFDGKQWQLANDPQPGAGGRGGSFMPPFGDAIAKHFKVPVGFVACGIGATSVREWLPKGTKISNPPTIERRVERLPDGQWVSKGEAFEMLIGRTKPLGPNGFRAVLWHQGESDANQKDQTRTLKGSLYREYLEKVIKDSNDKIDWKAPWFVAQASYHVPGDEASPEIRDAQASTWKDGVALEGPDSDAIKGSFRQNNGKGVHFSGEGLREHANQWAEKVIPWLEQQLK